MNITGWLICMVIAVSGIWVLYSLTSINRKFKEINTKSRGIYKQTKTDSRVDANSGYLGYDVHHDLDIEAMNDLREKYNSISGKYYSYVQSISLFPLMGLFGTVFGLIPGLKAVNGGDLEALSASLSTALYSTLLGIFISIVLKLYVAYGPSRAALNIENNFAENDRRYDYALGFGRIADQRENRD